MTSSAPPMDAAGGGSTAGDGPGAGGPGVQGSSRGAGREGQRAGGAGSGLGAGWPPAAGPASHSGSLRVYAGRLRGWQPRAVALHGTTLCLSRPHKDELLVQIELRGAAVAEVSSKNINHSMQILLPDGTQVMLAAASRADLETWLKHLRRATLADNTIGNVAGHNWYLASSNNKETCDVCWRVCGGVGKRYLICEACQMATHRDCAANAELECKWTTAGSMPAEFEVSTLDGALRHQWVLRGVQGRCYSCRKATTGPAYFCLWCKAHAHGLCRVGMNPVCSLGRHALSTLSPAHLVAVASKKSVSRLLTEWRVLTPPHMAPLVVFVNSRSGSNDGVRLMRMLKYLLNPAQVFDLNHGGPAAGLKMLQDRPSFRALGCGGDGTIGWILHEADKLHIRSCQLGVMPLGTGNDLARVLGWGASYSSPDLRSLSDYIDQVEKAKVTGLDRWSVKITPLLEKSVAPVSATTAVELVPSPTASAPEFPVKVEAAPSQAMVAAPSSTNQEEMRRDSAPAAPSALARQPSQDSNPEKAHNEDDHDTSSATSNATSPRSAKSVSRHAPRGSKLFRRKSSVGAAKRHDEAIAAVREAYINALTAGRNALHILEGLKHHGAHGQHGASLRHATTAVNGTDESPRNGRRSSGLSTAQLNHIADQVKMALIQCSDLLNSLHLLRIQISRSFSFAHDASSRVEEAMERCTRITDGLEERLESPDLHRESFEDVILGVQTILDSVSGFMAAHDSSAAHHHAELHASAYSETVEQGQEISIMNNYFGIGLDAKIAFDFDQLRNEHPEKCRSRMKNQMWYALMGSREVFMQSCKNLHRRLRVECDGKQLKLPKLQGIVVLNIPSYMGGADLWGAPSAGKGFQPQSFNDGLLELVGFKNSSEMAACKAVPGYTPMRLAQAKSITITISGDDAVPVQVDGEPWMQQPCVISITHRNCVPLLSHDALFQRRLAEWEPAMSSQHRRESFGPLNNAEGDIDTLTVLERAVVQAEKSFPRLLAAVPEAADAEPSLDHALTLQNRMTMALRENRLTPSLTEDYITAVAALCETVQDLLSAHRLHETESFQLLAARLSEAVVEIDSVSNLLSEEEIAKRSTGGFSRLFGRLATTSRPTTPGSLFSRPGTAGALSRPATANRPAKSLVPSEPPHSWAQARSSTVNSSSGASLVLNVTGELERAGDNAKQSTLAGANGGATSGMASTSSSTSGSQRPSLTFASSSGLGDTAAPLEMLLPEQVAELLERHGLGKYKTAFADVDGDALQGMTTEEMMDVGMTADDCEALQAAIETVKAHGMHRKDSLLTTSTV